MLEGVGQTYFAGGGADKCSCRSILLFRRSGRSRGDVIRTDVTIFGLMRSGVDTGINQNKC